MHPINKAGTSGPTDPRNGVPGGAAMPSVRAGTINMVHDNNFGRGLRRLQFES
jgi:hypothetical protein